MATKRVVGDYVSLQRGTTYQGSLVGKPGPALLGLGSIVPGGGFRHSDFKTYGGECPANLMLFPGDLYVSLKGATKDGEMIGSIARVPPSVPLGRLTQDTVKLIFGDATPEFRNYLYWLLRTPQYRSYCSARAMGSAVVALSRSDFLSFPVSSLTPAMANLVLLFEAIDEKLELNRKMNETLEAMARALFKSWFVDFDPVRAKAEGRDTGLPATIAALFPDSFEDSELGEIPKGWRASTLGAETERHGGHIQTGPFGSQLHASDYSAEGVPVVMPQDIANRRVSTVRIARINESDAQRLARHRMETGDIIFSRRGDVERHAQISARETGWLCGTGCLLVRMGPQWPPSMFMSLALDRPESRAWITQHAIGATMPNLNTGILSAVPLVVPPGDLLQAFARRAEPIEQSISARNAECRSLESLRDALLPKLISGELRLAV